MTDPSLDRKQIEALLRESDCPEEFIQRFLAALTSAAPEDQLRMLRCQRCRQLDRVHNEQRKLDGLDFLRYQLEKQSKDRPAEGSAASNDK
ncbi:MAG: hypothetical protein K2O45_10370 [Oscillospiraceae bacterium]|nr:hypothetical protein [Oscillospiraceae bacterium]